MVNQSAAGFFGTESAEFDNTLIKNYHGIQVKSFNNSKNTGEGVYIAGIYNEITQNSNTSYANMYGIYTSTDAGSNSKAPKNLYGIYVNNVKGGDISNYSIYTNVGKVRFGDNVGIGINNPNEKLEVSGAIKVASTTSYCNSSNLGTIKFENDNFYGCKSTGWVLLNN